MKLSYTIAQVREADNAAITAGTSVETLMERAGAALANAVQGAMRRLGVDDVLFVCGGGNNGGDGFVAARILQEQGEDVAVLSLAQKHSPACAAAKNSFHGETVGLMMRRRYALIVDCVLGTGLKSAPTGDAAALIEYINNSGAYVIACDIPSGLFENGVALAPCVKADETVSMGLMKNALLLSDGADVAGEIQVADIGLMPLAGGAEVWESGDVRTLFPKRKSNSNKGSYGSAVIIGGSAGSGAGFLAAGACLKSGAGYTKLYFPQEIYPHAVGKLLACILREFHAVEREMLDADCLAIGMGAGTSENLYHTVYKLLTSYQGTLVLDADALNSLSEYGKTVLQKKTCKVVITPHPKEFSRLIGVGVGEVLSGAVTLAQEFARTYGVTVVLKNNRTVITDGTRVAINTTGSPALAKGGSGDVLTGLLAGTCARGVEPYEAAVASCFVLGRAGELAAKALGEYSVDATDIIDFLPDSIKNL